MFGYAVALSFKINANLKFVKGKAEFSIQFSVAFALFSLDFAIVCIEQREKEMKLFGFEIRKAQKPPAPVYTGSWLSPLAWTPRMSAEELLSNGTVNACVGMISDAVAVLPLNVYHRLENGGREKANRPDLRRVLKLQTNFYQMPYSFKKQVMSHLLLKGNAFVFVDRTGSEVVGLYALDPEKVEIKKVEGKAEYFYRYTDLKGSVFNYTADQVIHIPAMQWSGVRGLSPIEYASRAPSLGNTLDSYTETSFDGGIHSKLMVTVPKEEKNWTKEDSAALTQRLLSSYGGDANAHKPLILSKGLTAQPLNLASNEDAQLLENKTYTVKEIAKIFRVPLSMLGESDAKYNNNEQQARNFLQNTLNPWLVLLQESFSRMLPFYDREDYYFEFDTNAMLRSDSQQRIDNYVKELTNGIVTLNEIRKKENLDLYPSDIGDKPLCMVNVAPLENALKGQKQEE